MSGRRVMGTRRIGEKVAVDQSSPVVAVLGKGGSIARMFPGYEERRPQLDLSAFIEAGIRDGRHILGEAGTGVGKSFAYLVPAILSKRRTVVAVPTIALQEQIIGKDLPFLSRPGVMPRAFTYALLKGRRNYACKLKAGQYIETVATAGFKNAEDAAAYGPFRDWYQETRDGDLGKLKIQIPMTTRNEITADSSECLGESCSFYGSCFGERAKADAKTADVVVTNYALLMLDLQLRSQTGGAVSILPDDIEVIILDECHQLREKAADAFTKEVTFGRFEYAARRIDRLAGIAQKVAESDAMLRMAEEMARAEDEGREPVLRTVSIAADWGQRVETARTELRGFFDRMADRLEESEESAQALGNEVEGAWDALYSLGQLANAMIQEAPAELTGDDRKIWEKVGEMVDDLTTDLIAVVSPRNDATFVRYMAFDGEGDARRLTFSYAPIDVAPFLRERLWSMRSAAGRVEVVSVSATVAEGGSLNYYRETVGLDDCGEIVVGSPFNDQRGRVQQYGSPPTGRDMAAVS
jgi:Rad3-related DNA helicase